MADDRQLTTPAQGIEESGVVLLLVNEIAGASTMSIGDFVPDPLRLAFVPGGLGESLLVRECKVICHDSSPVEFLSHRLPSRGPGGPPSGRRDRSRLTGAYSTPTGCFPFRPPSSGGPRSDTMRAFLTFHLACAPGRGPPPS